MNAQGEGISGVGEGRRRIEPKLVHSGFHCNSGMLSKRTDGGVGVFFAKEAQSCFPNSLDGDGQQMKYSHM